MGYDAGFDLYPSLNEKEADKWAEFLAAIRQKYSADPIFVETATKIEFAVGEHPSLDINGMNFRRFSSKISGQSKAESYLRDITDIARRFFPGRVFYWNELGASIGFDVHTKYDWGEVYNPTNKYVKKISL
jgi:hypothetical protein